MIDLISFIYIEQLFSIYISRRYCKAYFYLAGVYSYLYVVDTDEIRAFSKLHYHYKLIFNGLVYKNIIQINESMAIDGIQTQTTQ